MAQRGLRKEFAVEVGGGSAAIRINTDEQGDALRTLTEVAKKKNWELRVWDAAVGVEWYNGKESQESKRQQLAAQALATQAAQQSGLAALGYSPDRPPSPLAVLQRFLREPARPDLAEHGEVQPVVLVMVNFHLIFEGARSEVSATIQHVLNDKIGDSAEWKTTPAGGRSDYRKAMEGHGLDGGDDTGKFLVGLMPATDDAGNPVRLPPELAPLFVTIEHGLPDEEELLFILNGIAGDLMPDKVKKVVCMHARGLTRLQAEGVFGTYTVEQGKDPTFLDKFPEHVWTKKNEFLNQDKLVTLFRGRETFADVVGQDGTKRIVKALLRPDAYDPNNPDIRARGVTLVGGPRTGKSLVIKALANEIDIPMLIAHPGNMMGMYVGETERMTRRFFQIVRVHAPCIVFIDEVEKVMPSGRGNEGDSGVGKRMAGTFMSQMQDLEERVFWAFTANSVAELHEAFLDDDRIDLKVYVGMPTPRALAAGWKMYIGKHFPREIRGVPYPRYVELDVNVLLKDLKSAKKVEPIEWAHKFVAALLCQYGDGRAKALARLQQADDNVHQSVLGLMVKDDNWTLARVKAVCRMARQLDMTLTEVSHMVPRKQTSRARVIAKLEKWAAEEAIDAETGQAFIPPAEREEEAEGTDSTKEIHTRSRRKIRKLL